MLFSIPSLWCSRNTGSETKVEDREQEVRGAWCNPYAEQIQLQQADLCTAQNSGQKKPGAQTRPLWSLASPGTPNPQILGSEHESEKQRIRPVQFSRKCVLAKDNAVGTISPGPSWWDKGRAEIRCAMGCPCQVDSSVHQVIPLSLECRVVTKRQLLPGVTSSVIGNIFPHLQGTLLHHFLSVFSVS